MLNSLVLWLILLLQIHRTHQNCLIPCLCDNQTKLEKLKENFTRFNYCALQAEFCQPNEKLLGCVTLTPAQGCGNIVINNMTKYDILNILETHNKLRSCVASGELMEYGFNRATQMKQIFWDEELRYLAELQLKQCAYSSDGICFVTSSKEKSFSNFGFKLATGPNDLNMVLSKWSSDVSTKRQNRYIYSGVGSTLEYMIHDQIDKMGCAMAVSQYDGVNSFLLNCIYNKMLSKTKSVVYLAGSKVCNACDAYGKRYRCNEREYKGLCFLPATVSIDKQSILDIFEKHFSYILIGGGIFIAVFTLSTHVIIVKYCGNH